MGLLQTRQGIFESNLEGNGNEKTSVNKRASNLHLFYCSYLHDENFHLHMFPKEIIQMICCSDWVFVYEKPFDQQGVLSWLRDTFPSRRNQIIHFDSSWTPQDSVFFCPSNNGTIIFDISQSRSIEILGQEADGTFCSASCGGDSFIITLPAPFRLKLTHITMSSKLFANSQLKSNKEEGPTFWGTNNPPAENMWELIENDWKSELRIHPNKQYGQATWKCITKIYYQSFKIKQRTDVSARFYATRNRLLDDGNPEKTLLSGLEMYGYADLNL